MTRFFVRTFVTGLALTWMPMVAVTQHAPHWTYDGAEGPTHWGSLDPSYRACEAGTAQSPIDIRGAKVAHLPPIAFSYQPSPLRIIDNGHTLQVTYAPGSFITVDSRKYELQQFHFHHPAEEEVNGRIFPLVAHLVHKSTDGALAVVAVLLTDGSANAFIDKVWKYLPPEQGREMAPEGVSLDASRLLPAEREYYTFAGSLTTPPCTEGVTWFVLKTPAQVSAREVAAFAKRYPHNARPVQPLNGRTVSVSK